MDEAARLRELESRRDNINQGIKNIDRDIAGAENALARGEPPERLVQFLRERNEDLRGHLVDLGAAEARIDDLKQRMAERDREPDEGRDAAAWDRKDPAPDADRAWYRKAQSPAADKAQEQGVKQRDWFVRDKDEKTPERADEPLERDRKR